MESKNKTNQPTTKLKLIDTENRLVVVGWQGEMDKTSERGVKSIVTIVKNTVLHI